MHTRRVSFTVYSYILVISDQSVNRDALLTSITDCKLSSIWIPRIVIYRPFFIQCDLTLKGSIQRDEVEIRFSIV